MVFQTVLVNTSYFNVLQSDDITAIDIPPDVTEIITEKVKIDEDNLDETSSLIKNWSLINEDIDTLIPEYDCVSTTKEKEQNESQVQLELEGKFVYILN